jgi:hypothetical protein
MTFTNLELSALHSIFAETPDFSDSLKRQLDRAVVLSRLNSGGGFFTDISVETDTPIIPAKVLGYNTFARVEGLEFGLGFVLFVRDGRIHQLEGYAVGPENTRPLDLANLHFTIEQAPFDP